MIVFRLLLGWRGSGIGFRLRHANVYFTLLHITILLREDPFFFLSLSRQADFFYRSGIYVFKINHVTLSL